MKGKYIQSCFVVALIMLFVAFAIEGCGEKEEVNDDEDLLGTSAVRVGKTFTISLESNPTTGYSWQAEFNTEFLELVNKEYVSESTLIGAGGTETFKFLALKQGQVEITMIYKRSWETEYADKKTYTMEILPPVAKILTVKQVAEDIRNLSDETVLIKGEFRGWDVGDNVLGTLITRSDWGIRDNTGTIYVTGGTGGLDPTPSGKDIGKRITLTAVVMKQADSGIYFLKSLDVKVE